MTIVLGRQVRDYDFIGCGTFTPLVLASGMWAMSHHAPNAIMLPISLTGSRILKPFPISYSLHEGISLHAGIHYSMADIFTWGEGRGVDYEPINPLQIDSQGNVNLSVIGDYSSPKLRGPGSAGVDALTLMDQRMVAYSTRHSKRTFVERVDFVSGLGVSKSRREEYGVTKNGGLGTVVTDLAVLEFAPSGEVEIVSVHPGVSVGDVRGETGFDLSIGPDVPVTEAPTREELESLHDIDPLRVRDFEFYSASERRELLPSLLDRELEYFGSLLPPQARV